MATILIRRLALLSAFDTSSYRCGLQTKERHPIHLVFTKLLPVSPPPGSPDPVPHPSLSSSFISIRIPLNAFHPILTFLLPHLFSAMASKLSSDTVDILSCSRCSRQYTSYSAYARHQKSHDHNRFYSCDICNLKFSRSDVLRRHKLVHGETNRNNRQRSIRACDNCRQSKIRCNNGDPCHHCIKSGKKCSYLMKSIRPSVQGFPVNSEGVTYNLPSSTGANAPLLQDNTSLPPSQASKSSDKKAIVTYDNC